jgi:hypothetical protein
MFEVLRVVFNFNYQSQMILYALVITISNKI